MDTYISINAGMQGMNKQEQYILKAAPAQRTGVFLHFLCLLPEYIVPCRLLRLDTLESERFCREPEFQQGNPGE